MPIRDGLYKVSFQTPIGTGNGVAVFDGGKLRGGDSIMHYSGTYSQDGDKFSAKVVTGRHSQHAGHEFRVWQRPCEHHPSRHNAGRFGADERDCSRSAWRNIPGLTC